MTDSFEIHIDETRDSIVAASANGPLHPEGAQIFKVSCLESLEQGFRHLIVDLGGVGFVCSSGVGALLVVSEAFEAKGGSVFLVNPSKEVEHVLNLLYLLDELNVLPSREKAFDVLAATEMS